MSTPAPTTKATSIDTGGEVNIVSLQTTGAQAIIDAYNLAIENAMLAVIRRMEQWIEQFVPFDSKSWAVKKGLKAGGRLRSSGKLNLLQSLTSGPPFKLVWHFDPVYKGQHYAPHVDRGGGTPSTPGTIIPFFMKGFNEMIFELATQLELYIRQAGLDLKNVHVS